MVMLFEGAKLEVLCKEICSAYTLHALRQLLRFKMGMVLCNIVDCTLPCPDMIFDLLEIAEQEGWLPVLLSAIAASRANTFELVGFMKENAPQALVPVKPGSLSEKLKTGLEAVIERKAEPAVQQVLDRFHADLQAVHDGVSALNRYKKLHDRLHALQIMLPQQLEEAADEARKGDLTAPLDIYAYQLRQNAEKARAEAEPLPTKTLELGWAATLDQVANLVEQGKPGKPAPLDRAIILLQTVLSESPRINAKLTDVVAGLRLEGLLEALKKIHEQFKGTSAAADVATALEGLSAIRPRLGGLMQEHFEWQIIDKAFAVAELMPGATLVERFPEWNDTRTRLANLFDLAPTKPWSAMLQKQIGNLEAAEAAHDEVKFERAFDAFRIVARDRFLDVDTQLLERSGHLATVAPALAKLV